MICDLDGIFDSKLAKKVHASEPAPIKQESEEIAAPFPTGFLQSTSNETQHNTRSPTVDEDVKPDISASAFGALTSQAALSTKDLTKEASIARRIELLQSESRSFVIRRLNALLLPTLLEVYGASVSSTIRLRTLVAMLKIAYFNKPEYLAKTLKPIPMASFLASILANRDQTTLVMHALQMVDLLLCKLPDDYHFFFRREGVMHEVDRLANQSISLAPSIPSTSKSKSFSLFSTSKYRILYLYSSLGLSDEDTLQIPPSSSTRRSSTLQAYSTLSSASSSGTRDQLVYRARQLRSKYAGEETSASSKADDILDHLRQITSALSSVDAEWRAVALLEELAVLFSRPENPVSSFELSESGLVSSLLRFTTEARPTGRK